MRQIKAAIIDLYDDYPNQAIASFKHILDTYAQANNLNISHEVFDLRGKNEVPGIDFDVYLSSGGPGSPVDSEGSEWENKYWQLIDAIDAHNKSALHNKKHVLFICHSFQLMCRRHGLGDVNPRTSESYGIVPTIPTEAATAEPLLNGLGNPFYVFDSREWQVVNLNMQRIEEIGATIIAIEQEREEPHLPRALMAIRFNPYFFATQFHPEVNPTAMKQRLLLDEHKADMVAEYGEEKYHEIFTDLHNDDKILPTYNTIIPRFLHHALYNIFVTLPPE